ncbi:GntR family transcriptional regulator [Pelagibacterium mangrovi]|uniref:GntR family transcriptional regulator n=1 Tax=Pelagibacterium mangrovi TaxID=3119828 RepID=UPI002FC6CCC5
MRLTADARPVAVVGGVQAQASTYLAIKQMILSGRYRPGHKLINQEVAQALGISRTPVREACERLHQEGYLRHERNRGYYVSEIDETEALNLYGVREALELYALDAAFAVSGRVETAPLRAIGLRYEKAIADHAAKTRLQVDAEFHLALAVQSGNVHLVQMLASIFERISLKMRTETYQLRLGEEAMREHAELIESLERGDPAAAARVLKAHISSARGRLLHQIRQWT